VTQVRCDGDEMQIAVQAKEGAEPVFFNAKDRTQIGYTSDIPAIHGGIEPCSQLKGNTAKIVYSAAESKIVQGELIQIEIIK
jgi:hypothetical protein